MAVVTQIQVRRGTAAEWTSANPTLASGEFGFETDTRAFKVGDGTTAWTSLGYAPAYAPLVINAQTGTTYTLVLSDSGKLLSTSNGSAQAIKIPTNASVAFPTGAQISIIALGTGTATISAVTTATTTIYSTGAATAAPTLRKQYSSATLIKGATDTWYVVGDIA